MTIISYGQSHVGLVKVQNEDSWLIAPMHHSTVLALVADGVSGSKHGEVASQLTVDAFQSLLDEGKLTAGMRGSMRGLALTMAVQKAHNDISAQGQENKAFRFMACTCTVAIADAQSVCVRHVGDSRLYHLYQGNMMQKTNDQTVAAQMIIDGRLTAEQAKTHPDRNLLAQALGVEAINQTLQAQEIEFSWQEGDTLLLCSDGLSDLVSNDEIISVLMQGDTIENKSQQLVDKALAAGGKDNITVLLLENKA